MLGTFTSFSPRKWEVFATVSVQPIDNRISRVSLILDVYNPRKKATQIEINYWNSETENFQRAVQTGKIETISLEQSQKSITSFAQKGLWVALGVTLAVGIPLGLVASRISSSAFIQPVISAISMSAGMTAGSKHWGESLKK